MRCCCCGLVRLKRKMPSSRESREPTIRSLLFWWVRIGRPRDEENTRCFLSSDSVRGAGSASFLSIQSSEYVPPEIVSRCGDSIGWWKGDTLVVETTNFLVEGVVPPGLKVVERFSPASGGDLRNEFTVDKFDYMSSYSVELPGRRPTTILACHEGSYAMGSILRGAALLESEAAGGE